MNDPTASRLEPPAPSRRRFLASAATAVAGLVLSPGEIWAGSADRWLAFSHTHTGEWLEIAYANGFGYVQSALSLIDEYLRDFRTNEVHPIDSALLDLLHALALRTGTSEAFEVISGYRSPRTNAALRAHSEGVARYSLHMQGKAIDVRLPDVDLTRLRDAALDLRHGGVGFYPDSDFVHIDTGRVRCW